MGCAAAAPTATSILPTATPNPVPPTATPGAIPDSWKMFTSNKYSYSIGYPTDWKVTPATELLNIQSSGLPHTGQNTADTFERPDRTKKQIVEIAAQDFPDGTTLDSWTSLNLQSWKNSASCESAAQESVRVGGEPATLFTLKPCLAFYILHTVTVHGHTGFLAEWFSNPGNEAQDRATFRQMLATLNFAK